MAVFSKKKLDEQQLSEAESKPHTVLLVDDEVENLRAMEPLLSRSCHVITAANGRSALARIRDLGEQELSMIISDQRMPEMSGTELLMQTAETHPDTIRIIVSGYSEVGAILAAVNKAKIYHFLSKPFESTDLVLMVKQALRTYDYKKETQRQLAVLQEQLSLCKDARQLKQEQLERALARLKALGVGDD